MNSRSILTIVLLMLLVSILGFAAGARATSVPDSSIGAGQVYVLQGRVYEGDTGVEPPNSTPLQLVTVSLYCSNNPGQRGTFLRSTITDVDGWYGLNVYDSDSCEYFNIIETDPAGYYSVGCTTVGGSCITANWIQYWSPLAGQTLTGNKFWDKRQATDTPTPTATLPPTYTPTPTWTPTWTPTQVPTSPAEPTPTPTPTTAPVWPTATPTATPTSTEPTPTPTPTVSPGTCQELLVNGDFETGTFAPWGHAGVVRLGQGRNSAYGAWLGGQNRAEAELWQEVSIPAGAHPVTLSLWWRVDSDREQAEDGMEVIIQHGTQSENLLTLLASAPLAKWRHETLDLTVFAGETVVVTFLVHTDEVDPSLFLLDDVSLESCGTSVPGYHIYLPLLKRTLSFQ